jgi:S1-C subfamily serine protease
MIYKTIYSVAIATLIILSGCQEKVGKVPRPIDQQILEIQNDPRIEQIQRSIVKVNCDNGMGTGIVISKKDGKTYVLTAHHVIDEAKVIRVSQREYQNHVDLFFQAYNTKIVAIDKDRDLALLEIDDGLEWTRVIKIKEKKVPSVGAKVEVIGFPLNGVAFLSNGIIRCQQPLRYIEGAAAVL